MPIATLLNDRAVIRRMNFNSTLFLFNFKSFHNYFFLNFDKYFLINYKQVCKIYKMGTCKTKISVNIRILLDIGFHWIINMHLYFGLNIFQNTEYLNFGINIFMQKKYWFSCLFPHNDWKIYIEKQPVKYNLTLNVGS